MSLGFKVKVKRTLWHHCLFERVHLHVSHVAWFGPYSIKWLSKCDYFIFLLVNQSKMSIIIQAKWSWQLNIVDLNFTNWLFQNNKWFQRLACIFFAPYFAFKVMNSCLKDVDKAESSSSPKMTNFMLSTDIRFVISLLFTLKSPRRWFDVLWEHINMERYEGRKA